MKQDIRLKQVINKKNDFLIKIIHTQSLLTEAEFNLNAFMQLVVEQMQELTPASGAVIELIDGDEMVYRAATGTVAAYVGLRLKIKNSISGLCVSSNAVLSSDDTESDSRVNLEACRKVSARSLIVTPLIYQGKTVGVLKILSKEAFAFSETDSQTLQLMAGFIASGLAHQISFEENQKMIVQLKTAQEKLYNLAHYDCLTNLINRRTFNDNLADIILKTKQTFSMICLMYLDIDHFKNINDSLGHDTGDALLKAFAARLTHCVRSDDLVARLGGDEFFIILNKMITSEDAIDVVKKIIDDMRKPFKLPNGMLNITTSIGVTFYQGENVSIDELIKRADKALYRAKEAGRATFKVFDAK